MKKFFKSFFKTLFFFGNYQLLPSVVFFWYRVYTFFSSYSNFIGGDELNTKGFVAGFVLYQIFMNFEYMTGIVIVNLIGFFIFKKLSK